MIPFHVVERWAGRSDDFPRFSRGLVKAVHLDRTLLTLASVIPFGYLVYAQSDSLLAAVSFGFCIVLYMNLSTIIALRTHSPHVGWARVYFVADMPLYAFTVILTGLHPVYITLILITSLANGILTGGIKLGIQLTVCITTWIWLISDFVKWPLQSEWLFQLAVHVVCFIFTIHLAMIFWLGFDSVKRVARQRAQLRNQKEEIELLNEKIKEQVLVRYLPPSLISDIFDGKISMDTKPHAKEITVLFSDLSGFTKMSEKHGAEVVSDFLNDYLTTMNETIFANHGTIDKFIGDAIMVIFGAPVEMSEEDQAKNAARCAIAMQQGMVLVNQKWQAKGLNEVSMRIGIHQGKAVVGNFGSKQRVDYTAIGPSVNLASRIETACTPGEIYVSQEVRELLHDEPATDLAGEFELKGIEGKTSLYKLVDWG